MPGCRRLGLVFAIGMWTLLGRGAETTRPNLLKNPGFEQAVRGAAGQSPRIEGWSVIGAGEVHPGEIALDAAAAGGGHWSVRFTDARHCLSQTVAVAGGARYDILCRLKLNISVNYFMLCVQWRDAEGHWVYQPDNKLVVTNMKIRSGVIDWETWGFRALRAPLDARWAVVTVGPYCSHRKSASAGPAFWLDNLVFQASEVGDAQGEAKALVAVPKLAIPPVIDGRLQAEEWAAATEIGRFTVPRINTLAPRQTSVRIGYDKQALYFGIRCDEPEPETMRLESKQHDGATYSDDSIELFFSPDGPGRKQYHFIINAAAVGFDQTESWDDSDYSTKPMAVTQDLTYNPAYQAKTSIGTDAWFLELRLPFRALQRNVPADFAQWGFNVTRNRIKDRAYYSWSPLRHTVFQEPAGFGRLVFVPDAPAVRAQALQFAAKGQGASLPIAIRGQDEAAGNVTVRVEQTDNGQVWQLAEATMPLETAMAQQRIELSTRPEMRLLWIAVERGGQEIFREAYVPVESMTYLSWNDPEGVRGNRLYVACDLPTYSGFMTPHNFQGGSGTLKFVGRAQHPVDLHLELPSGVRATKAAFMPYGSSYWKSIEPASTTRLTMRTGEYVRYSFALPCVADSRNDWLMVVFETDRPEGWRGTAFGYLEWPGGKQPPVRMELEVVKIGRLVPFEKFVNNMYGAPPELLFAWLPHWGTVLPTIGINRFDVDVFPTARRYGNGGGDRKDIFDRAVTEAKRGGMYLATSGSDTSPIVWSWTTYGDAVDADSWARDHEGHVVKFGSQNALCPRYRGRCFEDYARRIANSPAFREWGVSWVVVDCEYWDKQAWHDLGFCDRCLTAFKAYTVSHCSGRHFGDPKVFMAAPTAHPEAAAAWETCKESARRRFYEDIFATMRAAVPAAASSAPLPGFRVSDWIWPYPYLHGSIDYFEVNCYYQPQANADRLKNYVEMLGHGEGHLMAALSPGQVWLPDSRITPDDMRWNIFEAAVTGCRGTLWYTCFGFNAMKLKAMTDGLRTIRPFETLFLDGKVTLELPCTGTGAGARAIRNGEESLVLVRAYGSKRPVRAAVTITAAVPCVVVDCRSHELLGEVPAGKTTVAMPIAGERARLLYAGPRDKWIERVGTAPVAPAVGGQQ